MRDPAGNDTGQRVLLLVATMTFFLFPFMASSVNVALPSIGRDLSLDAVTLGWVATAYLLSSAAFLVPVGRIADIYGRKRVFMGGIAIFTVTSLLSGLAGSGAMLIAFRVLQGIGVAMFAGTGVALLTSVFPSAERGRVLGLNAAAVYTGLALGPVLGGILTEHLGWRSIFFLTVPLGLLIIGLGLWKLRGEWTGAMGETFDVVGSIIYSLALVAVVYGFTLLPEMSGVWLLVGGVVGLFLFARWEMKTRSPVLDMNLFRNSRAFSFSSLAALLEYSPILAVSFLISFYLQYVKGFNPESAGLVLIAMPAASAVLAPFAGRLSDRIEPRIVASVGMALTAMGVAIFIFLDERTPLGLVIGNLILVGLGQAFFSSPNTNAIMSSAPVASYGVASAIVATMRQIGFVMGMGVTMLMLALYVGRVEITPEYYPLFQQSMRGAFMVLSSVCFIGIFVSLARGRIRKATASRPGS
ncbi:MAG: MFS transporter [Dehalococcoidia bacterium]|nr:MFS transporter [Dehalococcoidia bacterium]